MKLGKRILAFCLIAVMLIAATACGNSGASGTPSTSSNDASSESSSSTTTTTEESDSVAADENAGSAGVTPYVENEEFPGQIGLSKYDPPLTFTIARDIGLSPEYKPGTDWYNNIWKDEREELLGMYLNEVWTAEGLDNYNQKLNLNIVSGDLPDIFQCNPSQFQVLYRADMLEDLTEAVDTYATDFFKDNMQYAGAQESLHQATIDGKLYAIPNSSADPYKHHYMFIREDWREKLGLPVPTNMEELYNLARAYTYDDPDGNGVDDTFGIALGNTTITSYMALNGFFNGYGAFPDIWIEKNGQIEYGSIQSEMKPALAEMARWYQDGLIDKEFIAKDNFAASQDAVAGKAGIVFAEWWLITWPLPDAYKLGDNWNAYIVPFDTAAPEKKVAASVNQEGKFVMRKGVGEPAALVKLSNIYQERILKPDADLTKYKGDGQYDFSQYSFAGSLMASNKNLEITWIVTDAIDKNDENLLISAETEQVYGYIKGYLDNTPTLEEDPQQYATNFMFHRINYGTGSLYGLADQMNKNGIEKIDVFKGALTDAMVDRKGQLDSLTNEVILDIITGAEPVDYFDTYVDRWKAEGGDDMTKEVNDWYAEQQ